MDKIEIYLDEETQSRLEILSAASGFTIEDITESLVEEFVPVLQARMAAGFIPGIPARLDETTAH